MRLHDINFLNVCDTERLFGPWADYLATIFSCHGNQCLEQTNVIMYLDTDTAESAD